MQELEQAINQLAADKVSGNNNILAEILKELKDPLLLLFYNLLVQC